jgi:hypothetical protein
MTLISPRRQPDDGAARMTVTVGWQSVQLQLNGDIDMSAVTFLDSTGVRPLVDAGRRRDHD